jgi:hypothetical protein
MAVKVVGEPPPNLRIHCARCRHVLEYAPEDVAREPVLNFLGLLAGYNLAIRCPRPECRCNNVVGEESA